MDQPVTQHLVETLTKKLERYGVVVFYNPAGDMREALQHLPESVQVLAFDGSYLKLKLEAEARFSALRQHFGLEDSLLLYVPEAPVRPAERDPLLEYTLAGTAFDHSLEAVTRAALKERFTDEQIAGLFEAQRRPSLADLDRWGAQETVDSGSLGVVYGTTDTVSLLRAFLEGNSKDAQVNPAELARFLQAATGLAEVSGREVSTLRTAAWRHLLLTALAQSTGQELRPSPPALRKAQLDTVRSCLEAMRQAGSAAYAAHAQDTEREESLPNRVATTGNWDVFAFQNTLALKSLAELGDTDPAQAEALLAQFEGSYWCELQPARKLQWHVARTALGVMREAKRVTDEVKRPGKRVDASSLAGRYLRTREAHGNWFRLDHQHRALEQNLVGLSDPSEIRRLIVQARQRYSDALYALSTRLSEAYTRQGQTLSALRRQERTFAEVVEPLLQHGPTAFFVMDALRYEMGVELAGLLEELGSGLLDEVNVHLEARAAVLPSITSFGMAALLPRVQRLGLDEDGHASVNGVTLKDWPARKRYWQQALPNTFEECRLAELPSEQALAAKREGGLRLLLVRLQDIDTFGEIDHAAATTVMPNLLGDIRRAVRTVVRAGFNQVVITADHGYLLFPSSSADQLDAPQGESLHRNRRYWLGHPNEVPHGAIALDLAASDLFAQAPPGVMLVTPKGPGHFRGGGNTLYVHGGASLQERLVPVITFTGKADSRKGNSKGKPSTRRAASASSLQATLARDPHTPLLRAQVKLAGQGGLLGVAATKPTLRISCRSEAGEVCQVLYPQSTSGEYRFGTSEELSFLLAPQGALEQRWLLEVRHDLDPSEVVTAHWSPGDSAAPTPPDTADTPRASSPFGKPLPARVPAPDEELSQLITHLVKVKTLPEPDLDAFLKQRGLGRRVRRKLNRYLSELAQAGYPLLIMDTSTTPPRYKLNESLLANL